MGWIIVFVVLIAHLVQNSQGCLRMAGRVARRPLQSGVEVVENVVQIPRRTKSLPNIKHKDPKVNPLDREPSDAMSIIHVDAQRRSSSLGEIPARTGTKSENMIPNSVTPSRTSKLREWARTGGRSFSRILGSSRLYSRRLMRSILMRWRIFKVRHPAAVKYAKYVSWLSGIAVSVGSAVSLPVELYRTFHTLNHTDTAIMDRIDNVTKVLDVLREKSIKEFEEYPDQTIFDLYHEPLRRDSRGTYRLGIEDIPRDVDNPERMDPLFQEIPGLPEILENYTRTTKRSKASRLIGANETNHQENDTSNTTSNSVQAGYPEKGFTWYSLWEQPNLPPRMIGWIMLAMAGVIVLLIYAAFILVIRKCCSCLCRKLANRNHRSSPRELPFQPTYELANLDNLSTVNNVNLYEVVPVPSVVPNPPISD